MDDKIENKLKKTLNAFEEKLDSTINGIKDSVNSALAESLEWNNTAISLSKPGANDIIEKSAAILTNSKLNLVDRSISWRRASKTKIETPPVKNGENNCHKFILSIRIRMFWVRFCPEKKAKKMLHWLQSVCCEVPSCKT